MIIRISSQKNYIKYVSVLLMVINSRAVKWDSQVQGLTGPVWTCRHSLSNCNAIRIMSPQVPASPEEASPQVNKKGPLPALIDRHKVEDDTYRYMLRPVGHISFYFSLILDIELCPRSLSGLLNPQLFHLEYIRESTLCGASLFFLNLFNTITKLSKFRIDIFTLHLF